MAITHEENSKKNTFRIFRLPPPEMRIREIVIFSICMVCGIIASRIYIPIPHTNLIIELRWLFGFMGFALLSTWWTAFILAIILSMASPGVNPLLLALAGNMLYATPALFVIRFVHLHILQKCRKLTFYGLGFAALILFVYQFFTTPVTYGLLAYIKDKSILQGVINSWLIQPYKEEALATAILAGLIMSLLKALNELWNRSNELQITLDSIGDGVITTDTHGRITRMNPVAQHLTGWSLSDALNKHISTVYHCIDADTGNAIPTPTDSILKNHAHYDMQISTHLIARDSSERIIAHSAAPLFTHNNVLIGTVIIFRDITAQKTAQDKMAWYHNLFKSVISQAPFGVYVIDGSLTATRVLIENDEAIRMFGEKLAHLGPLNFSEPNTTHCHFFTLDGTQEIPPTHTPHVRALQGETVTNKKYLFCHDDGREYYVNVNAAPIRDGYGDIIAVIITLHDITDTERVKQEKDDIENQLQQFQKMESIGRLAGGVAHDLNNLLAPILGYGQLLMDDKDITLSQKKKANHIVEAGMRARDLVHQLLAFSRKQMLQFTSVDLNEVMSSFHPLLRRTIREDIEITMTLAPSLPHVYADIGQLEQVIMNLAVNAQDAMHENGKLSFETACVELDEHYVDTHQTVVPGPHVMLSVSDTGCGMNKETTEHIFEPFFTTKQPEKGTGLGLSTVFGIVKQHKGHICVYSEPGKGTLFKIYIPTVKATDTAPANTETTDDIQSGTETILLVEDNDQVRDVVEDILDSLGYTVITAINGKEALSILAHHTSTIDLLLTDVVMPEIDGKELYTKACEHYPELKVIYMSGYTKDVITHHGMIDKGILFIQKPFSRKKLAAQLREVLDM